jgi:hypothetical protein
VATSCVVGYNDTSIEYRIIILAEWKIVVSRDVKFDKDVSSSSSHGTPLEIEWSEKVVVRDTGSEVRVEFDLGVDKVRLRMDIPSPTTMSCREL